MKSPSAPLCLVLAFAAVCARASYAAPVFVPDDYPTIQQAVDAADTVHVRPGVYHQRPRLPGNGRPHLLRSYPSSGRVVLDGMTFDGALQGTKYKVQGIDFSGTVALETHDQLIGLTFERCRFDSGLVQTAFLGMSDWDELALRRCRLHGDLSGTFNYVFLEQDTLRAGGIRLRGNRGARVLSCNFEGGDIALDYTGYGIVRANGNVIRGYRVGIYLHGFDSDIEALDNSVTACAEAGILLVPAHRVTLSRNRILDCGAGIDATGTHDVVVTDNRVQRSQHVGIATNAHNRITTITGNVVGRSGGAGIVTRGDSQGAIENNTSYSNGDHGFVLGVDTRATVSIRRNIGYGNTGYGLSIGSGTGIQIGCNDWFANTAGEVLGLAGPSGDLAVDPKFCDVAHDSVGLARASVLIDVPGCGTIGALGVSCNEPENPSRAGVSVTPCNAVGWSAVTTGGGMAAVTATHPHPTGSLELRCPGSGASAMLARAYDHADPLAALTALSVALYREDGGSAPPDVAPAVQLLVENARGERSTLVWEPRHNGAAAFPIGQWTTYELSHGIFWQRVDATLTDIDRYDRRLTDWLEIGTVSDAHGDVSIEVGPDARVVGYAIGLAGGVGDFAGAADDFRIAFGARDTTFSFEHTAVVSVELTATETSDCGSVLLRAAIDPPGIHGPIEFREGDAVIASVEVANIGQAWFTARGLETGSHRFSASFGTGECTVRSDTIEIVVHPISTAITLGTNRNPAKLGDPLTFTARMSTSYPTGTVEFRDGQVPIAIASLATGIATCTATLSQGTHTLTAVYGGDACHAPSTSASLNQIVGDPPVVSVSDLTVAEGNAYFRDVYFTLSLSGASLDTVTVDYATRDGSATLADSDYQGAAGTATFLPGGTEARIQILVIGDQKLEADETLTLAIANPTIAVLGDSIGVATLVDDDRPEVQFGNTPTAVEGTGDTTAVSFFVTLAAPCSEPVTVHVETEDVTATAGQDYLPVSETLRFAPGDRVHQVVVSVLGDSVREESETFRLVLSAAINARLGITTATARIRDDDRTGPNVSIDDATVSEGDAGATMRFRVWLSHPDGGTIRVTYGAIDSTARMEVDYEPKFGVLTFPPMVTEVFLEVAIHGDDYCEDGDETFRMRISNPVDAEIVRSLALGTILDDDCIPLTLLKPFTAEIVPGGVALRWQLNAAALSSFVERSESPAGPWAGIETGAVVTDGSISALDRTAQPLRAYWYRLVARSTSNTVSRFGPIEVNTPEHMPEPIHDWALGRVAPNPSPGSTEIEFLVAEGGPVRLEILDVQGRRVALLADGVYSTGAHVAVWDGGRDSGAADAGLYFVRFRAAGRTWIHRLAMVR